MCRTTAPTTAGCASTATSSYLHERGAGDRIQVFVTDQEPAPAFELGQRMFAGFEAGRRPTAIYATSDTTAIGLMQAAFQAGVAIPEELSIIGYDDIDISPFTIPPLTTISQDGAEMGTAAADLLFTMIDENLNREEVSDVVLQPGSSSASRPPHRRFDHARILMPLLSRRARRNRHENHGRPRLSMRSAVVEDELAPPDLVEVGQLGAIHPADLVVLGGEVGGAAPAEERLAAQSRRRRRSWRTTAPPGCTSRCPTARRCCRRRRRG